MFSSIEVVAIGDFEFVVAASLASDFVGVSFAAEASLFDDDFLDEGVAEGGFAADFERAFLLEEDRAGDGAAQRLAT